MFCHLGNVLETVSEMCKKVHNTVSSYNKLNFEEKSIDIINRVPLNQEQLEY